MKWSLKIGQFKGIGVYIHATFLLIIVWIAIVYAMRGSGFMDFIHGVIFVLAIFACVVLHEFGHALTARQYGIPTKNITLYPIGGVARLQRMPDEPKQEFWVAVAGPAVNVVIAAVIYGILQLTGTWQPLDELTMTGGSFWIRLMIVNLFLVVFNIIPAFPMDGGRILRSLLAMKINYVKATNISAMLGQGFALLFGFLGFFTNPFLIFIALFVWIGASQEAQSTEARFLLHDQPVKKAMITDFEILNSDDSLKVAVDKILSGSQHDFPVMEGEKVAGILTRSDLMQALKEKGQDHPVRMVMHTEIEEASPDEELEKAFLRLQRCKCHTMPVMENGKLSGLLTMENVGEFMMIHSALNKQD